MWLDNACAKGSCTGLVTAKCDGLEFGTKICHFDTECKEAAQDADCATFKSENACKLGTKDCKWASPNCAAKSACTDYDITDCTSHPLFIKINGVETICKKGTSATTCEAGAAADFSETTCSEYNDWDYAWKDGKCQFCASAADPEGGNGKFMALGFFSLLVLLN